MEREPKPYEVYRHFKGNLYQIVAIALHSEDGSKQVVYQQLYSPYRIYVRPYDMFISEVDREKYPESAQTYRFERVAPSVEQETTVTEPQSVEQEVPGAESQSEEVNPKLLEFLDAESYAQRMQILDSMKSEINDDIINTISAALELEVKEGSLQERYEDLMDCLAVYEKYECNRLR